MGELLVFLGIGVLLWFLSALQLWIQRQRRGTARDVARESGPPVPPVAPRPRPLQAARQAARPRRPEPVGAPPVVTRQRPPGRLGSRQDLRRGMILMTILGSCRALEPPDPAQ